LTETISGHLPEKYDVISFSQKRFCALGLELGLGLGLGLELELRLGLRIGLEFEEIRLNTFSVKRPFWQVS